jgi:hypothetical protein
MAATMPCAALSTPDGSTLWMRRPQHTIVWRKFLQLSHCGTEEGSTARGLPCCANPPRDRISRARVARLAPLRPTQPRGAAQEAGSDTLMTQVAACEIHHRIHPEPFIRIASTTDILVCFTRPAAAQATATR